MFREHLQNVRSAASAAVTGRRGRSIGDLTERPGTFANGPLDGPVFDVVAPADGLQTADYRMLGVVAVHDGEGNTRLQEPLPRLPGGLLICGFGRGGSVGTDRFGKPRERAEDSDFIFGRSTFGFRIAESYPFP
jgi:hypothetical protein